MTQYTTTHRASSPSKADAARALLQPQQRVVVQYVGPAAYFVSIEGPTQFTICNDQLLTKREAFDLAAEVRQQLVMQRLAAEGSPNRMARAMALVADGKVHEGDACYTVESQTEADACYTVGHHGCNCPDKRYRDDVTHCKHELAVKLYRSQQQSRLYRNGRELYHAGQEVYDSDHPDTIAGWMDGQAEHERQAGPDGRHVRYEEEPGQYEASAYARN